MWQPADQVEFKLAFNAISHVGVDPEHPPIGFLSRGGGLTVLFVINTAT
jgi:hypothetical protein